MTSTGSASGDGFRGVFEASISGSNLDVNRRPYHKNCTCALHNNNDSRSSPSSSRSCPHHKPNKVTYPIKRSWSEGSFSLHPAPSLPNLNPSSSSSDLVSLNTPPSLPRPSSSSSTFDFFISHHHQDM